MAAWFHDTTLVAPGMLVRCDDAPASYTNLQSSKSNLWPTMSICTVLCHDQK